MVDRDEAYDGIPRQTNGNWHPAGDEVCSLLLRADVQDMKLLPSGSNYVFVLALQDSEAGSGVAIYKPRRGESPLWDYPNGTLFRRERAAFVVSEVLGWGIVPPTVLRDGPHGAGMVQLHIDHRPREHYFTIKDERQDELRRMAIFDVIVNNGDRKGGHCLIDYEGRLWGIDHGLTFHQQGKLRTVIWDFIGERVPDNLLTEIECLLGKLTSADPDLAELHDLLEKGERRALRQRIEQVLTIGVYPEPPPWRPVPWPAI